MKKELLFFTVGAAAAFGITAFAAYMDVNPNPFPITLNGAPIELEGYNINGNTYFKLRDIGEKTGFLVDFQDNTIVISKSAPNNIPGIGEKPSEGGGATAKETLDELCDRLAKKVASGEMTQAEADEIIRQFGALSDDGGSSR